MDLTKKHCVPCEGGTSPLSNSAEDELLKMAPGWIIDRLFEHKIRKIFMMKTFPEAIEFVNKIAIVAEREDHHPDLYISYRKVTVELWTHSILGLTENDFIMAAKINELTG